jgi:hypothetical protein
MKTLAFVLRFSVIVPVCLIVWWWMIPYYGWMIGQIAAQIMGLFGERVTTVRLEADGFFNTETLLTMESVSGTRSDVIAPIVTNLATFVALVLATAGLNVRRRLQVLGAGAGILMASHVVFLVWAIAIAPSVREAAELPIVVAQIFITMPFLLWIVLAHWQTILDRMTPDDPQS